jgi:hypothetical protein
VTALAFAGAKPNQQKREMISNARYFIFFQTQIGCRETRGRIVANRQRRPDSAFAASINWRRKTWLLGIFRQFPAILGVVDRSGKFDAGFSSHRIFFSCNASFDQTELKIIDLTSFHFADPF